MPALERRHRGPTTERAAGGKLASPSDSAGETLALEQTARGKLASPSDSPGKTPAQARAAKGKLAVLNRGPLMGVGCSTALIECETANCFNRVFLLRFMFVVYARPPHEPWGGV